MKLSQSPWRKDGGLSQEELAEAAGVHRTYAGMIERVYLDGDQLRVHGLHGSLEARVDMSAPTPGCVESAQRLEDLERASVQAGMQTQERMYGQQVRGALQPPVMAL